MMQKGAEKPVEYNTVRADRRRAIYYYLYAVVFCLIAVFLFWKCRYGFGNIDESFYITIPYRLVQGDNLFLNEWHLSQMSSVLLVPAVKLQLLLYGGMDGVILHFRYLFTAVWIAASLFVFLRLRRFSPRGAAFASYVFMLYTPFSIMALSYNSMGILTLALAGVILITAETFLPLQYAVSGVFYAASVLCCPFLAIIYPLYSISLAAVALAKKSKRGCRLPCDAKKLRQIWLYETLGAAVSAGAYLLYAFRKMSVGQLLEVLPHIMNDPEHSELSFLHKVKYYITDIFSDAGIFLVLTIVLFAIVRLGKKYQNICLAAMYGVTGVYIVYSFFVNQYLNHIMFPLNLFGLYCALLNRGPVTGKLWCGLYLPGILYTFCVYYSSNQRFYVISSVSTVSVLASILFIVLYTQKLLGENDVGFPSCRVGIATVLTAALMFVQIGTEAYLRFSSVFWETSVFTQTEPVRFGPEKGLLTTPERLWYYTRLYDDATCIGKDEPLNVLFLSDNTWLYLCGSNRLATYSAWLSGVNEHSLKRLETYYEINEDKVPDIVWVESSFSGYILFFAEDDGCVTETRNGNFLIDMRGNA
jgi:hypothetical protein